MTVGEQGGAGAARWCAFIIDHPQEEARRLLQHFEHHTCPQHEVHLHQGQTDTLDLWGAERPRFSRRLRGGSRTLSACFFSTADCKSNVVWSLWKKKISFGVLTPPVCACSRQNCSLFCQHLIVQHPIIMKHAIARNITLPFPGVATDLKRTSMRRRCDQSITAKCSQQTSVIKETRTADKVHDESLYDEFLLHAGLNL